EYATWDGGVAHYAVYRKMETDLDFAQIENSIFPTNYNTYTDDVAALYGFGSVFQYYVEATENVNQYGFNDRSKSNYIALTQLPNTYIPNAFSPLAMENKVFMPINSFVSPAEYRFQIFDRYGNLLFFTKDPYKGWDGRVKGDLMPIGVYVYTLSYKYPDGKIYQTKGTVTLVK
ncbi:MAG: gliding motility-associated C-terminal domain-containing protein, partial [Bacteroidales bacterium]